jgi:hypothetical protein
MQHRWSKLLGVALVICLVLATHASAQTEPGPYAWIGIMRAIDGHSVEWDEGYIRHLEWHRQVKDPFKWYSYSVWASAERQGWIAYATFGHAANSLSNPWMPAEDRRDSLVNLVPHAQFLGNWVFEYLPALSRGDARGVPTPALGAELTTVDVKPGAASTFEAAIAAEQPKLQGETLWYRLVIGGEPPRYLRLRPRASLAAILDARGEQALPEKVTGVIAKITVETLNLRPNMLVNVTPPTPR